MSEITVKAYGLVKLTKKPYIITQTIVFVLIVCIFIISLLIDLDRYMLGNAQLFILVIAVLEAAETFFMLRAFRRKEKKS